MILLCRTSPKCQKGRPTLVATDFIFCLWTFFASGPLISKTVQRRPIKSISVVVLCVAQKIHSDILPTYPLIFTGMKYCQIWPTFGFQALWFWNEAIYLKSKQTRGESITVLCTPKIHQLFSPSPRRSSPPKVTQRLGPSLDLQNRLRH